MPTIEKSSEKTVLPKLEYHATVHDLPSDERPRERLQHYGPQALSNAELIAIILRTGTTRDNVIELAGKLLAKYGGLGGLMRAEFGELCAEYGLGTAKASQLKAALEMGRRLGMMQNAEKYQIKVPCSLTFFDVRFVLDQDVFCSPCITRVSRFSPRLLSKLLSISSHSHFC